MFLIFGTHVPCYLSLIIGSVTGFDFGKLPSMFANYKEYKQ